MTKMSNRWAYDNDYYNHASYHDCCYCHVYDADTEGHVEEEDTTSPPLSLLLLRIVLRQLILPMVYRGG